MLGMELYRVLLVTSYVLSFHVYNVCFMNFMQWINCLCIHVHKL
jgi:hypothetical protein